MPLLLQVEAKQTPGRQSQEQHNQLENAGTGQMPVESTADRSAEADQDEEEEQVMPAGYISRRTTDPYMQKKLRGLQVCKAPDCTVRFLTHQISDCTSMQRSLHMLQATAASVHVRHAHRAACNVTGHASIFIEQLLCISAVMSVCPHMVICALYTLLSKGPKDYAGPLWPFNQFQLPNTILLLIIVQ